jgi:hypothetical protein
MAKMVVVAVVVTLVLIAVNNRWRIPLVAPGAAAPQTKAGG